MHQLAELPGCIFKNSGQIRFCFLNEVSVIDRPPKHHLHCSLSTVTNTGCWSLGAALAVWVSGSVSICGSVREDIFLHFDCVCESDIISVCVCVFVPCCYTGANVGWTSSCEDNFQLG